jgi:hypothetical protein
MFKETTGLQLYLMISSSVFCELKIRILHIVTIAYRYIVSNIGSFEVSIRGEM